MTGDYSPIEIEGLVEIAKQFVAVEADHTGGRVMISKTHLIALIDQLEAARGEIDHLTERDLFRRDCEWCIATHPEPWRIGRAGDLVAMSGEAIAIPKKLRMLVLQQQERT